MVFLLSFGIPANPAVGNTNFWWVIIGFPMVLIVLYIIGFYTCSKTDTPFSLYIGSDKKEEAKKLLFHIFEEETA